MPAALPAIYEESLTEQLHTLRTHNPLRWSTGKRMLERACIIVNNLLSQLMAFTKTIVVHEQAVLNSFVPEVTPDYERIKHNLRLTTYAQKTRKAIAII